MTHRYSFMRGLCRFFFLMLLQTGQPSAAHNKLTHLPEQANWEGSEQMVHRLTRSLRQQGRLSTPHDSLTLHGTHLSARNFWLHDSSALEVLKGLQQEYPSLNRLQVATNEFVLSGEDNNIHCLVSLNGVEARRLAAMISCATLRPSSSKPIFSHPALSVQWSWHEHYPTQSVHQQVVEIHGDRKKTHTLIQQALRKAGWAVRATEQSVTATQQGRHLLLSYLEDKRWNNAAYLIEIRTLEKQNLPLSP